VLASVALTSALNELTPVYENATGDKLSIEYSLAADQRVGRQAGDALQVGQGSRIMGINAGRPGIDNEDRFAYRDHPASLAEPAAAACREWA